MKKTLALMLAAALSLSLASCGSKENNSNIDDSSSEYKEDINIAVKADTDTFDPMIANGATADGIVRYIYSSLLQFDNNGVAQPHIFTDWTTSEDERTWTFNVRDDVYFHNGKHMTASDIEATLHRAMDSDGGLRTTRLISMFESVEAPDDTTVVITTKEPYGPMLSLLCNLWVMDSDTIDKYGNDIGKNPEAVNGTGPYKLANWEPDQEILMERFDDYFLKEKIAKTKYLREVVIPESSAMMIALETGEVDISKIPNDDVERFKTLDGFKVVASSTNGQRCFRFGCNDEIMSNVKVRQAILYAIDRQVIIDTMFNNNAVPTTGPFTPADWGYADLGVIERDLEKSRQLLAEAGYPDGFDTTIMTTATYAKGDQLAEVISAQLKDVGINAKIEVLEWSTFMAVTDGITADEFDYPIFIMGTGPTMRDPDGSMNLYKTTESGLNDLNYGFYSNPEFDELAAIQKVQTNPDERKETLKRLQEIVYLEDPAAFWLFDQKNSTGMTDKLEGFDIDINGYVVPMGITIKK